ARLRRRTADPNCRSAAVRLNCRHAALRLKWPALTRIGASSRVAPAFAPPMPSTASSSVRDTPTLVQVRDMYKSFQHGSRKLDVLRGVNLQLDAGEMV